MTKRNWDGKNKALEGGEQNQYTLKKKNGYCKYRISTLCCSSKLLTALVNYRAAPHLCTLINKRCMAYEYKLPSLGDGVVGKVTEIRVRPGDLVTKEQIVLVVGTDKVDAEMPVDVDGIVEEVLVKVGDDVTEGTPILRIQLTNGASTAVATPATEVSAQEPPTKGEEVSLVSKIETREVETHKPTVQAPSQGHWRASPLARKRAKEFGIELSEITPAPGSDRISYKDVLDYVKRKMETAGGALLAAPATAPTHRPLPNFEKFGPIERQPQSRIGVITADNMVYAFNAIPHAWISEKADITRLEQLRLQYKEQVKAAGGNLTTTGYLGKSCGHCAAQNAPI